MHGFKPTGSKMRSGFHFPKSMGFSGSTGNVTTVSGYTRRKFARGGAVKATGGMKRVVVGDAGHALVQRNRPSNNLDQQSGGKTPLRSGFRSGGPLRKADGGKVGALRGVMTAVEKKRRGKAAVDRAIRGAYTTPGVDPYRSHDIQAPKWEAAARKRAAAGKDYRAGGLAK